MYTAMHTAGHVAMRTAQRLAKLLTGPCLPLQSRLPALATQRRLAQAAARAAPA